MGSYLVPKLLASGYCVDAATLDNAVSMNQKLTYYREDFLDFHVLRSFLNGRHYDAIIDFMTYSTAQYAERYELLLSSAKHFIFVSSYRVYSDQQIPTVETSPRLLDVTTDSRPCRISRKRPDSVQRCFWTIRCTGRRGSFCLPSLPDSAQTGSVWRYVSRRSGSNF